MGHIKYMLFAIVRHFPYELSQFQYSHFYIKIAKIPSQFTMSHLFIRIYIRKAKPQIVINI